MPLSSEEQSLFDHARNALPRWLTGSVNSALEWLYGFTEIFANIQAQGQTWLDLTYLENCRDNELDQHALDRGTSRRAGESDAALLERLRNISDSLTEPALLTGVDAMLDSLGFLAHFKVNAWATSGWNLVLESNGTAGSGDIGVEGTLSMVNDGTTPAVLVERDKDTVISYKAGTTTRSEIETLIASTSTKFETFTGSSSPASVLTANDAFGPKHFVLSGIVCLRRDRGHVHANGSSRSFVSRGYRNTGTTRPWGYIVILPYAADAATASAVAEYLRKNGPAGYVYTVERRQSP